MFNFGCYLILGSSICLFFTQYVFYDLFLLARYKPTEKVFNGKFVVITGASTGLGRSSAIQFCEKGAHLIITARSKTKLDQIKKDCSQYGNSNVHAIAGDMSSSDDIFNIAKFVKKTFHGGIDHLLLNHVGPYQFGYYDGDLDYVRLIYQVNYLSYIDLTRHLLSSINKRSGQIMVISALAGKIPIHVFPVYSSTKHALEGFFTAVRSEFHNRQLDITISSIVLGGVATESAKKAFKDMKSTISDPTDGMLSEADAASAVLTTAIAKPDNIFVPSFFRVVDLLVPIFGDAFFDRVLFTFMGSDNVWNHTWNDDILGK